MNIVELSIVISLIVIIVILYLFLTYKKTTIIDWIETTVAIKKK